MGAPVPKGAHRWQPRPGVPGVDQCPDCGAMRCRLLSGLELVVSSPLARAMVIDCSLAKGQCRGQKSGGNSEGSDDHQA